MLGIHVSNNVSEIYELNFDDKMDKVRTIINIWNQRNLSVYGKSLIVKTFVLSQFMYHISVLPTLNCDIDKKVNDIIFKFLWNNKPDKIRRDIMCSDYQNGGIKYPNMKLYIISARISWFRRIMNNDDLIHIVNYYFPYFAKCKDIILNCNLKKEDVKHFIKHNGLSIIYEIFYYWCDVNYRKWDRVTCFYDEIVFFNSNIRINNKPVVNMSCIRHNVIKVKDFMIDCILFLTYDEFKQKYGPIIIDYSH